MHIEQLTAQTWIIVLDCKENSSIIALTPEALFLKRQQHGLNNQEAKKKIIGAKLRGAESWKSKLRRN